MSESCLTNNPLVRDGTSQKQRLLKSLLPTYVLVDERNMKDLALFANKLAAEVNYHEFDPVTETTNISDWIDFFTLTQENWESFSLDEYLDELKKIAETAPHLALFFGFLYMFKVAQDDLNTLTKRHLDFYYRDVLQLRENPAVADQVAIIFALAKNVESYLVKEGTELKAGKDDTGVELIYKTDKDIVVNKGQVEYLRAVYANINNGFSTLSPYPDNDHRIYASPVANSSDGEGADIETEEKSWETFGQPSFPELGTGSATEKEADREQADIGFAIASPILFLAEGERKITIKFTLPSAVPATSLAHDHFVVRLSGEKEWIIPESDAGDITQLSGTQLTITRTIDESQEAVIAYDQETLLSPYETNWPVVQVLLNTEKIYNPFIYKTLKSLKPTQVEISVDVTGVKTLVLQNDEAVLDASKPFLPFGTRPYIGSNFYVGSWEVFQKKLDDLSFHFKWNDLPNTSFDNYYGVYEATNTRKNSAFKIDIKCIDKKQWVELDSLAPLFTYSNGNGISDNVVLPGSDSTSTILVSDTAALQGILRDEEMEDFEAFDHGITKGFVRLTLKGKNFGHKDYPNVYAKQAIALANEAGTQPMAAPDPELAAVTEVEFIGTVNDYGAVLVNSTPELPNPPYTPSMQDFSLSYESSVVVELEKVSGSTFKNRVEKYFLADAFGTREIDTTKFENHLLPQYANEANLYIGIKDLVPPQTLSILFQVAEGSANPDKSTQKVLWHYLAGNDWVAFKNTEVLSDSTNGLLTSGIVSFSVPKAATKDNTLLDPGYHWIRVAVQKDSDAICKLIDVQCQAVLASFNDNGNDPDHLRVALPAETISKLKKSNNNVDEISQPYASFNGKVAEESADFYTRVSERLRHKQRAITIFDYEKIILQQFPSVYKVKCANHTRFEGTLTNYSEIAPGHVTLIIVSNVQNKNAVDPLRPKTSLATLDEIYEYIVLLDSMSATIHVKNPIYEEVRVKFNVKFLEADIGYYQAKLEEEIKGFLSPWASGCSTDIVFGGRIHRSVILNFVEERSYVDYVTCFEMNHIVPLDPENNPNKDVEEAVATTAISILGSSDSHFITPIPEGVDCLCDDNVIPDTEELLSKDDCPCKSKK
ncbi:MAG: baseplate J/gp47 family protein, partial [bacterium]